MLKKMVPWLIMILIAITLITLAAFVLWEYIMKDANADPNTTSNTVEQIQLSNKEISELTVKIDDITTNLSDLNHVVKISFAFVLSNKKAKEEMEMIEHLAKGKIVQTLIDTSPNEIRGSAGKDELVSKLINLINPLLEKGNIIQLEVTDIIVTTQR